VLEPQGSVSEGSMRLRAWVGVEVASMGLEAAWRARAVAVGDSRIAIPPARAPHAPPPSGGVSS
jgi:hypothetical protein